MYTNIIHYIQLNSTGHFLPQFGIKYKALKSEAQKNGYFLLKSLKAFNEKFHDLVMDYFSLFVRGQSILTNLPTVKKLSNSWMHAVVIFWQLIFLLQGTSTVW